MAVFPVAQADGMKEAQARADQSRDDLIGLHIRRKVPFSFCKITLFWRVCAEQTLEWSLWDICAISDDETSLLTVIFLSKLCASLRVQTQWLMRRLQFSLPCVTQLITSSPKPAG